MRRYYITWENKKAQETGLFECKAKTIHHAINHFYKSLGKDAEIMNITSFDCKENNDENII